MTEPGTIRIACKGAGTLPYTKLERFQGELKVLTDEGYAKLKGEIVATGFSEPISVWIKDKHHYVLNGHQRLTTVRRMVEEEAWEGPDLPVSYIEARSLHEARKKVLSLTSQYGKLSQQGLFEYMGESGLSADDLAGVSFPEFNMDKFREEHFGGGPPEDGLPPPPGGPDDGERQKVECPECGHEFDPEE